IEIAVFESRGQTHRSADGIYENSTHGNTPEKLPLADGGFGFEQQVAERDARKRKRGPRKETEIGRVVVPVQIGKNEMRQPFQRIKPGREKYKCRSDAGLNRDIRSTRLEENGQETNHQRADRNAV